MGPAGPPDLAFPEAISSLNIQAQETARLFLSDPASLSRGASTLLSARPPCPGKPSRSSQGLLCSHSLGGEDVTSYFFVSPPPSPGAHLGAEKMQHGQGPALRALQVTPQAACLAPHAHREPTASAGAPRRPRNPGVGRAGPWERPCACPRGQTRQPKDLATAICSGQAEHTQKTAAFSDKTDPEVLITS